MQCRLEVAAEMQSRKTLRARDAARGRIRHVQHVRLNRGPTKGQKNCSTGPRQNVDDDYILCMSVPTVSGEGSREGGREGGGYGIFI